MYNNKYKQHENKTIKENQKMFQNRKDNYMNFAIMIIYAVIPILTLIILLVIYSKK